jgi:hypothetical protein
MVKYLLILLCLTACCQDNWNDDTYQNYSIIEQIWG